MAAPLVSLLLPTRGRPALALRLLESLREHTRRPERIEVVLYADEDDPASHALGHAAFRVKSIIGPRLAMGACNSACLARAEGDILILINDDMVVRTSGWDEIVRETDSSHRDKIYLAYANDLFKGRKLCSFPILSRRTCEVLADPYPAAYQGAFIDYHLLDIFKRLQHAGHPRIRYLEHLVFEHLHYRSGKAEFDATYRERDRFADDAVFLALRDARSAAAARLHAAIENRPAVLRTSTPAQPTASRSLIVAVARLARPLLGDAELPLRWRGFLYLWFCGRTLARPWLRSAGRRDAPARSRSA